MLAYLALEFGVSSQLISYYNNSDYYQMITQEIVERRRIRQMDRMRRLMFDPQASFRYINRPPRNDIEMMGVRAGIHNNFEVERNDNVFNVINERDLDMWDLWQENQRRERLRQQQLEQEDNHIVMGEIADGFGFSVMGNITDDFKKKQQNSTINHSNTNTELLMNQEDEEAKDEKFYKNEIFQYKIKERIRNSLNPEEQLQNDQNSSFD
eukprot:403346697